MYKTAGLGDVLREALAGVEGIGAAFVYGSVAKGMERSGSDVDLLVIGNPDPDLLHRAVPAGRVEVDRLHAVVARDLATAEDLRERNRDWAPGNAYNAMLIGWTGCVIAGIRPCTVRPVRSPLLT